MRVATAVATQLKGDGLRSNRGCVAALLRRKGLRSDRGCVAAPLRAYLKSSEHSWKAKGCVPTAVASQRRCVLHWKLKGSVPTAVDSQGRRATPLHPASPSHSLYILAKAAGVNANYSPWHPPGFRYILLGRPESRDRVASPARESGSTREP